MSKNIAEYEKKEKDTHPYFVYSRYRRNLCVTAYVSNGGRGIQFTIGSNFTDLSESQVKHLIKVLQKRMAGENAYDATHPDIPERVQIPVKADLKENKFNKNKTLYSKKPRFAVNVEYKMLDTGDKQVEMQYHLSREADSFTLHPHFINSNYTLKEASCTKFWGLKGKMKANFFSWYSRYAIRTKTAKTWKEVEEYAKKKVNQFRKAVGKLVKTTREMRREREQKPEDYFTMEYPPE